jgi:type I restriction enzyme R subunit
MNQRRGTQAAVEQGVLDHLAGLGYAIATDAEIGPDGKAPEREAYADVVLAKRLTAAIEKLNPVIPAEARGDALRKVLASRREPPPAQVYGRGCRC